MCIWFARQGVDITCLLGAKAPEQLPGALPDAYQREGTIPNSTEKGWRPGRKEAPSSPELLWCWNNLCTAEEVGRSTDQVAGVQMGTGEMLRASLPQIPAFLSRENNQDSAANWGCILQTLLFLTNK